MELNSEVTSESLLKDLQKWVSAEALKIDNIEKYDLKIYGNDDKAEHYGSDIAFVDLSAENFKGEKREYYLIIKYSQKSPTSKLPIRDIFEREIEIYEKLIPLYHRLQDKIKLPLFSSVPKCYLTKLTDTKEVIILENLKKEGYSMHNRKIPMDVNHIKLVLEAYAEWHALSFVLKDQEDKDFLKITNSWIKNPFKDFLKGEMGDMVNESLEQFYETLEKCGELKLIQKFRDKIENMQARDFLLDLLNKHDSQSVVLHGDCWNNNFMFKYEGDSSKPSNVVLLDFQITSVRSPVFDITHFLYAVASEEELSHFKELVDYYYSHLSRHIKLLGSDPNDVFSYLDLKRHLKKFGGWGAVLSPVLILFTLVDKENAPDFENNSFEGFKRVRQDEEYKKRVTGIAKHFVEFSF